MSSVYFGVVIGIFLSFAGSRFLVVAVKAWKERKIQGEKRLERIVEEIVNRGE